MRVFLSAIIGGIGAVSSFIGQRKAANAAADQSEAAARVAEKNAQLVDQLMADSIFRQRLEERNVVNQGRAVGGAQRVAMAANGLDLSVGSPLDIIFSTQIDAFKDVDASRRNLDRELVGLEREKVNYTAQAKGGRAAASSQRQAGTIGAIASAANSFSTLTRPGGAWANIGG